MNFKLVLDEIANHLGYLDDVVQGFGSSLIIMQVNHKKSCDYCRLRISGYSIAQGF